MSATQMGSLPVSLQRCMFAWMMQPLQMACPNHYISLITTLITLAVSRVWQSFFRNED
jgi:hypothetical protein